MTMTLHKAVQIIWYRVNRPSGCWFPVSARFQEPSSCPWAHPLCPHGQMTKTLHIYRPRRFQWTCLGVNRPSGYRVPVSARFRSPRACPLCPPGYAPMGKWPGRCTSTGQDGSNELVLEWIDSVAAEFRRLQDSRAFYHSRGPYSSDYNYCTLFNNPNSHRTVESLVMTCSENGRDLFQANLNSLLFGKFRGLWTKE